MSYIARNPEAFLNLSIGTGQCVALAERAAMAPRTQLWRRGKKVRGACDIQRGTIIATFDPSGSMEIIRTADPTLRSIWVRPGRESRSSINGSMGVMACTVRTSLRGG
jgi:hypothetical protein